MRYLLVILLVLVQSTIVACGTAEHQKEKSAAVKAKYLKVQAKVNEKARATNEFFAPSAKPSPTVTPDEVDESASAPVVTNVQTVSAPAAATVTPAAASEPASVPKGTVYVASIVTWAEAVNGAPAGKRMATRDELFALWDSGAFKKTNFSTAVVWTATAKNTLEVWCLSTYDGSQASAEKSGSFSTVYVDK